MVPPRVPLLLGSAPATGPKAVVFFYPLHSSNLTWICGMEIATQEHTSFPLVWDGDMGYLCECVQGAVEIYLDCLAARQSCRKHGKFLPRRLRILGQLRAGPLR